jgi:menaquinone-dependent protoporphyrinogen IX oxidase
MTSEPRPGDLAERTEDLSRFESEGGSSEHVVHVDTAPRERGLQLPDPDQRGRVLVVYAARERHTHAIADVLAVRLRGHGFTVELGDAAAGTMPPPEDYDVVIVGMPMSFGRESDLIASYVDHNRRALSELPTALFTVSDSGSVRDHDPGGFLEQFLRTVAWLPDLAAAFAGGEPFPREGVLQRLAAWTGDGGPTRSALRTDWTNVEGFADAIATELAKAAVDADRTEPHHDAHPA